MSDSPAISNSSASAPDPAISVSSGPSTTDLDPVEIAISTKQYVCSRGTFDVTVGSYNVLSPHTLEQKNGTKSLNLDHMEDEYRIHHIVGELMACKADVLCVQELQSSWFYKFFKPTFDIYGYESAYAPRDSKTVSDDRQFGVAMFVSKKLHIIQTYKLKFSMETTYVAESSWVKSLMEEDIDANIHEHNTCLAVVMEFANRPEPCKICVSTVHLTPKNWPQIKYYQLKTLMSGLVKIQECEIPLILVGDFNFSPKKFGFHDFVRRGYFRDDSNELADLKAIKEDFPLVHPLNLSSVYAKKDYKAGFTQCSVPSNLDADPFYNVYDYIYYQRHHFDCHQKSKLMDRKSVIIPNEEFSSDHTLMLASFSLKVQGLVHQRHEPNTIWKCEENTTDTSSDERVIELKKNLEEGRTRQLVDSLSGPLKHAAHFFVLAGLKKLPTISACGKLACKQKGVKLGLWRNHIHGCLPIRDPCFETVDDTTTLMIDGLLKIIAKAYPSEEF